MWSIAPHSFRTIFRFSLHCHVLSRIHNPLVTLSVIVTCTEHTHATSRGVLRTRPEMKVRATAMFIVPMIREYTCEY